MHEGGGAAKTPLLGIVGSLWVLLGTQELGEMLAREESQADLHQAYCLYLL